MARRYFVADFPEAGRFQLPAETAHHVARVMRMREGDELCLFDGKGKEARARLTRRDRNGVEVVVRSTRRVRREPAARIELAFSPPRAGRAQWLLEHATEVGVCAFRPVIAARTPGRDPGRGLARWQRIVRAAAEQCDRSALPRVHAAVPLEALLGCAELPRERYLADAGGPALGAAASGHALLLVGPEGGFTAAERTRIGALGFAARSLGPLTLRVETAALAGAVLLLQPPPPGSRSAAHGTG